MANARDPMKYSDMIDADDLSDIVDVVMEMDVVQTEAPHLPFRCIWKPWTTGRATTSRPPAPPTRAAPTPPTGRIFQLVPQAEREIEPPQSRASPSGP